MSRKRRGQVRRRISGPLAAALLFVFIFEHLTAPFSYATSPDMASASDAIQSGRVTWTDRPEEDVQIAVLSDAVSYGAGELVCLDVYIKNNTADEITDGFLKYAGSGIEKDRESTYFEDLSEDVVWEPADGSAANVPDDVGADDEGLGGGADADDEGLDGGADPDQDSSMDEDDQDLEDADTDDPDPDVPDVLTDLQIAPGQSYHVQFYHTISEDLQGARSQNVEFTFRWKADDQIRTSKQTFRYVVGAMNLLPVEIMSAEQAAGTEGQLHAGERGQMLLDFDLGDAWEIIEERLEEEHVKADGTDETGAESGTDAADAKGDGTDAADTKGDGADAADVKADGVDTKEDGAGAGDAKIEGVDVEIDRADPADTSQEEMDVSPGNEEAGDSLDADPVGQEDAGPDEAADPESLGDGIDHDVDPASYTPSIEMTEAADRQLVREPVEAGSIEAGTIEAGAIEAETIEAETIEAGVDTEIATPSTADGNVTAPYEEDKEEEEKDTDTKIASPSTAEPKQDDPLNGLVKWEDDLIDKDEKPVIKDISCSVETYELKLNAFRVADEEDKEADSQSTSVRCTFRVDEETEPGIYYGNVTASYRFKNHTFRSTQGFILVVPAVEDEEVAEAIRLIDGLPEQEEVEEAFAAYDLAEDEDGRDTYYMELYEQVMEAYRKYMALSGEQQEKVYNRDKLMAYEWLWGGAMFAADAEVTDWQGLKDAIAAGGPIITLANDINGTDTTPIPIGAGEDITLDLNGHTLTYTGSGNDIFSVAGSFTIAGSTNDDQGGTILGKTVGNVINVGSNGKLWIKGGKITTEKSERAIFSSGVVNIEGGAISDNHNVSGRAGGIWVHGSTLNIRGGSIDHNSAPYGGGIYTWGAVVNISGGTIAYNTATEDGGGICDCHQALDTNVSPERNGSTINITGGSIEYNKAKNGGGVYVNSRSLTAEVIIEGGNISNNHASENGGGIYARSQNYKVTIKGGEMTDNKAKTGGGIAVSSGCPIELSGGSIADNSAEGSGGGIAVSNSTLGITGGAIKSNTSQGNGGGIAVSTWCTIDLSGGAIADNESEGSGGGIAVDDKSIFNIKGGTIKNNTSKEDGGGVVFTGTGGTYSGLYIEDGEISGNHAWKDGGGVAITGDHYQVQVKGGTIAKNKAGDEQYRIESAEDLSLNADIIHGNGGGIYIAPKSDLGNRTPLTISGGSIAGNEAYAVTLDLDTPNSVGGGGIFTGSDLTITGGEIKDNYAAEGGGGILSYYRFTSGGDGIMPSSGATRPKFKMTGGTIAGNVAVKSEGGGLYFQGEGEIFGGQFTGNETRTIYDYGGGGIFIMTNATLKLYNALITDNDAEGYGGGLAGCAKSNTYIFSIKGGAIYHNRANGDHAHLTISQAGDQKVLDVADFGKKSNGSKDYFCSGKSVVYDHMLGGGHSRWSGFCDGDTMAVPLNGFVKTKENSAYADNKTGKGLMGLTADPVSDDIAKVGRVQDKVIITGNRSNTHGGGISSNGVLYLGEGTGTDWEPSAEKIYYVDGKLTDPTKGQFTFVMLDKGPERDPQTGKLRYEEQSVVSTATNNEKGEIRFSIMADRAFSPEDFTSGAEEGDPQDGATHTYTFYVMEKDEDIHTIRYDTTVYKIDITMKMHVREEEDVQDNIVSTVKIYHYTVEKDADGKAHMTVTVMRPDGSGPVEGDKIEFTNFWTSPPPDDPNPPDDHDPSDDHTPPEEPTQPAPPPEDPPIIPSEDRGNGSVVEIIEEEINVPIFALPDAQLPEMPEQITLFENGVPRGYRRVWNPDTQQWEWIPEDEVPLSIMGLPRAGDASHPMLWLALFAVSAIGIVVLVILRKKSRQEQDMDKENISVR